MIQLPESTYIGKKIPKEEFYNNLILGMSVKRAFVDDIGQIIWRNLLSSTTLKIGKGQKVNQIDVVQISLKRQDFNRSILEVIEKSIPRHLIFLLTYNNLYQLHVNYKEEYQKGKFKIINSFTSNWFNENEISLTLKGLDIDQVYEDIVFQIAGSRVEKAEGADLKKSIEQALEIDRIKKKITELEAKLRIEKQYNIQLRISNEIKEYKNKLSLFGVDVK